MQAIIVSKENEPIQKTTRDAPAISEGECLIKLSATALNRRDQWIREGRYPNIVPGTVLGSDGVGVVENGNQAWKGQEVIINPNVDWGENPDVQSAEYSILGMPSDGTLAEYITVPSHRLHKKPSHLTAEEAAALPLAGLTAYRATIKKGGVTSGFKVLITGIGGGVSQLAMAFAYAVGAEVYVTSGQDNKIQRAIELGAKAGFNYKAEWAKEAIKAGPFDVIVDSAGGDSLNDYLKIIQPAGKIVLYGSTTGYPQKLDVFRLFWSQAQILGSTMGNDKEFEEMLELVKQHQIVPTVDKVYDFDHYLEAFDRFKEPDHFGKIVIKCR